MQKYIAKTAILLFLTGFNQLFSAAHQSLEDDDQLFASWLLDDSGQQEPAPSAERSTGSAHPMSSCASSYTPLHDDIQAGIQRRAEKRSERSEKTVKERPAKFQRLAPRVMGKSEAIETFHTALQQSDITGMLRAFNQLKNFFFSHSGIHQELEAIPAFKEFIQEKIDTNNKNALLLLQDIIPQSMHEAHALIKQTQLEQHRIRHEETKTNCIHRLQDALASSNIDEILSTLELLKQSLSSEEAMCIVEFMPAFKEYLHKAIQSDDCEAIYTKLRAYIPPSLEETFIINLTTEDAKGQTVTLWPHIAFKYSDHLRNLFSPELIEAFGGYGYNTPIKYSECTFEALKLLAEIMHTAYTLQNQTVYCTSCRHSHVTGFTFDSYQNHCAPINDILLSRPIETLQQLFDAAQILDVSRKILDIIYFCALACAQSKHDYTVLDALSPEFKTAIAKFCLLTTVLHHGEQEWCYAQQNVTISVDDLKVYNKMPFISHAILPWQTDRPYLSIAYANLTNLDGLSTVEGIDSLKSLNLSNNNLSELDPELLNRMPVLEYITINNNKLRNVSAATCSALENIRTLSVRNNQFETLEPDAFAPMHNLRLLNIARNGLTEIKPGTFRGLTQLVNLDLEDNKLETVTADSFEGLNGLRTLQLRNNQLTSLEADTFRHLPALRALVLTGNRLKRINKNAFRGLANLEILELSENLLQHIDLRMFERLPRLLILRIASNRIKNHRQVVKDIRAKVLKVTGNELSMPHKIPNLYDFA